MNENKLLCLCLFLFIAVSFLLAGCCFGQAKCNEDNRFAATFRIVDAQTGQDLLFGSSRKYNPAEIKLYSIIGTDTIASSLYADHPTHYPGRDSLLYAQFNYRRLAVVFMRLNSNDIDTLQISYKVVDASPCCPDYNTIQSIQFNNKTVETQFGGFSIIKK